MIKKIDFFLAPAVYSLFLSLLSLTFSLHHLLVKNSILMSHERNNAFDELIFSPNNWLPYRHEDPFY